MAITKQQKKEILEKITDKISKAKAVVFVGYEKVKIEDQDKLRKNLKKENGEYLVTKKTILSLALKDLKIKDLENLKVDKEIAIALSYGDEIMPAKLVANLAKRVNNLKIKGGILENKIVDLETIKFLSSLPPKEILRAQLVSGISSPLSGLMNVLQANLRSLVNIFDSLSKKSA